MINGLTDFNLLLLLLVGGLSVAFIALTWSHKHLKNQLLNANKQLYSLKNEFRAMNSGHLGMGRKLRAFAQEIASVEQAQQLTGQSDDNAKSFEQAGVLLAKGVSIEEVVQVCGISPAEAELLAILRHSAPANVAQVPTKTNGNGRLSPTQMQRSA
ncbi:DUF2802 domain-containing protein [Aliikangiella sp. IMCC44653]